ncbi:MAG: hypothetical protein ACI9IP_002693 [Arcticibacterium sp.]
MVSLLIGRIASLQSFENGKIPKGGFLSLRKNGFFFYKRSDNNLFATASVGFILKGLRPYLEGENLNGVSSILNKLIPGFDMYQNKDGLMTYNFWTTRPTNHFPFGYLMRHLRHFKLPDDIDDTALVYMVKELEIDWLKDKLKEHAGDTKIYGTWFGQNMPIEYDVCALSNLMYLIFDSGLPLNEFDEATLVFLKKVLGSKNYLDNSFWVSRHYGSVPLIVYHYGRFLGGFNPKGFADVKLELIRTIEVLFNKEEVWMNNVLLQSAYIKLGGKHEEVLNWNALALGWEEKWKSESFAAFIGAPFAPYNSKWTRFLASKKLFQIQWKSEAHELALILENVVLRNTMDRHER